MLAHVTSCALAGLEGRRVVVEVDIHAGGLPQVTIVGLPGASVREAKDRLQAALRNAGFVFPLARITINLAPAALPKVGTAFDLPMALGLLVASGQLRADLSGLLVFGEVALDGRLRPTRGVLPVAAYARAQACRGLVVPSANGSEAALVEGLAVTAAGDLTSLCDHLTGRAHLPPPQAPDPPPRGAPLFDLADVRGQELARRALEIAAAGGHNLLMTGPPGAGKTLLARCLPSILPPLSLTDALEVTAIYSVAGELPYAQPLVTERPFRSPHHTISPAGLAGGGPGLRPGEVSLAHLGVLFLDELPEFDRRVLESLRAPLEDRVVTHSRAAGAATYPASISLVAARNPCPCGYYGDSARPCSCPPGAVERYARRLSGPLLDRFDLHVTVARVPVADLVGTAAADSSADVRRRVEAARSRQTTRYRADQAPKGSPAFTAGARRPLARCNAELSGRELRSACALDDAGRRLMRRAVDRLALSARAYQRVLKVARTVADLEGEAAVAVPHLEEALVYRGQRNA